MAYTVYGKPGCTACQRSLEMLDGAGKTYRYVDVSTAKGMQTYLWTQHYLSVHQSFDTWPRVFQRNAFVGGETELRLKLGIPKYDEPPALLPPIPYTSYDNDWPGLGRCISELDCYHREHREESQAPPVVAEAEEPTDDAVPAVPSQANGFFF